MLSPAFRIRILRLCAFAGCFLSIGLVSPAQQSAPPADSRIDQLYGAAKASQSRGDIVGAISNYEALLRIAPYLAPAYNNLGMLYLNEHDYPKAAEVLKKGLAIDPHMPSASALLGMALFESGNYADSRTALESALKANPADNNAQLLLAKDLINPKDMDAASAHLRLLSQRDPHNQEVWYLLGEVYMQLSEQALAKMNAIDPGSPLVHEVSGEMMEDMKNYQGALAEYKKAVEMAPDRPGTHYRLGNIDWKLCPVGRRAGRVSGGAEERPVQLRRLGTDRQYSHYAEIAGGERAERCREGFATLPRPGPGPCRSR
jgi:tetratricopeptide (TPR) repeat protein